ncbi:hypothetical protein OH492_03830 [Vibrio chagasii]|nr:hypothetical protein [Vibrio chagasii]
MKEGKPELILIATGSEVELAVNAAAELTAEGKKVRNIYAWRDAFDRQDAEYRESVLPSDVTARIAVEAGIADFWYKYVGFRWQDHRYDDNVWRICTCKVSYSRCSVSLLKT